MVSFEAAVTVTIFVLTG